MSWRIPVTTQEPVVTSEMERSRALKHIRLSLVPPATSVSVQVLVPIWDIQMIRMLTTTGVGAAGDRHAVYQQLRQGYAYFNSWGNQTPPSYVDSTYHYPGADNATLSLVAIGSNSITTYRNIPRVAIAGDILEFRLNNGQVGDSVTIDVFVEEIY